MHRRNADYKRGVDADEARRMRDAAGLSIRKGKRAEKMERRRGIRHRRVLDPDEPAHARPEGAVWFTYDKNALLQREDPAACLAALTDLAGFLGNRPPGESNARMDADVAAHFGALFYASEDDPGPSVLGRLVQLCDTCDPEMRPLVKGAADCLVNVTGCRLPLSVAAAEVVLRAGFLRIVARHVSAFHEDKNPLLTPGILLDFWIIAGNMCIECDEVRDVVINSPLFRREGTALRAEGWQSPVVAELRRLCAADEMDPQQRAQLLPPMLQLLYGSLESGRRLPPWEFIRTIWPHLLNVIDSIPARPEARMDPELVRMLDYVLCSMLRIFRGKNYAEQIRVVLFDTDALLGCLARWYFKASVINKVRICNIIADVAFLPHTNGNVIARALVKTGWLSIMTGALIHRDVRIKHKGASFMDSLARAGFPFVEAMVIPDLETKRDTMRALTMVARTGTEVPRKNAISCLVGCFESANNERAAAAAEGDKDRSRAAINVMWLLIRRFQMFRTLSHSVYSNHDPEITGWILDTAIDAAQWATAEVCAILEETGIRQRVDSMINSTNEEIYAKANILSDLMDGGARKEEEEDPYYSCGYHAPNDIIGVLQGGFLPSPGEGGGEGGPYGF